ncbi:hypothetical protein GE061_009264 [Apolygus lucorum]|uniref:Uncharacterized protein n=1 Tax=Apolygus lucorum TaxID=248454 RepID=A0A6A4KI60_APOLU|nr:hypothetical protein GE061_009264 [Apolygus lucorum]
MTSCILTKNGQRSGWTVNEHSNCGTPALDASFKKHQKKTGKPFIVNEVATEEVLDLKQLEADMQVNFKINSDKEKVLWTEMEVIRIVKGELKYKTDHRAEEFKEICFERRRAPGRPPSKKLSPAYKKPPKIPAAKAKDLMDLCQINIIPKVHHSFYKSLN